MNDERRHLDRTRESSTFVWLQWSSQLEAGRSGKMEPRGHITGPGLKDALDATAKRVPRSYSVNTEGKPVTDFDYSVEAPRTKAGASRKPPENPVPESRWIFTFGK